MSTTAENQNDVESTKIRNDDGTYGIKRMQMAQAQVNEVIDVMRNNVNKVMERENQLSNLDHRADVLQAGASQFQQSSRSLRQKYWWQNIRMMIIMGLIALLIIILVVVWINN